MTRFAIVAYALLFPSLASAHTQFKGMGDFVAGVLHPFSVLGHILLLVSLVLWLGISSAEKGFAKWLAFGLAIGLVASIFFVLTIPQFVLLLLVLIVSLFTVTELKVTNRFCVALLLLSGMLLGLDSAPENETYLKSVVVALGTFLSMCVLFFDLLFVRIRYDRAWVRIACRIIASWIAACAIMVLVFLLRP